MRPLLVLVSHEVITALQMLALLVVVGATIEVLIALPGQFRHLGKRLSRPLWLRYARWLVAALTLQLGADIVESSITHSWVEIARLGAIAVIRTFLNFFLDRDVTEELHRQRGEAASPEVTEVTQRAAA